MLSTIIQYAIVVLAVAISVVYIAARIRRTMSERNDPCSGCTGCGLRDMAHCAQPEKRGKPSCHCKKP